MRSAFSNSKTLQRQSKHGKCHTSIDAKILNETLVNQSSQYVKRMNIVTKCSSSQECKAGLTYKSQSM